MNSKKQSKKQSNLATYKRMMNIAKDIMSHLGENTRLSHQILYVITYYTCETIAETHEQIYDIDIADSDQYFGLVPKLIMNIIFAKIVKDYKGREQKLKDDFSKSNARLYNASIRHISNMIHAYLLDNHSYKNLPCRIELVHCDLERLKRHRVYNILENLASNYVDGIESIDIPKAIREMQTLSDEDLYKLELAYPNYYKIKLQREVNSKNTLPQVYIIKGQITLVNRYREGTRYPMKYQHMPALNHALWMCTRMGLISQHKELRFKNVKNENTGDKYIRFETEKVNFYEYAERNKPDQRRLEYHIKTHVLSFNLGNIIYYEPHPTEKHLIYLFIRTDHLKELDKIAGDSYEMYDINLTKLAKIFTQKEHTVFCNAILPHIQRYHRKNENTHTFEIDVNKVLKDLGYDENSKSDRYRIHKIVQKILDTLKRDIIPSPKAYDLKYSKDENIYTVELNSVYEYVETEVNALKTINISEYMLEQLRKNCKKQLKQADRQLKLKGQG